MKAYGFRRHRVLGIGLVGLALACGSDSPRPTGPPTPVLSTAFAGIMGALSGTLDLTLLSDGTGTGTCIINGVQNIFTTLGFSGTTVTGTCGGFTFIGTLTQSAIDGAFSSAVGSGLFSALEADSGVTSVSYCGDHNGTDSSQNRYVGPFNFVSIGNAIRGIIASGAGGGLEGIVTGHFGNDSAQVIGTPGSVTVLPSGPTAFGGFYDFNNTISGGMQGGACP